MRKLIAGVATLALVAGAAGAQASPESWFDVCSSSVTPAGEHHGERCERDLRLRRKFEVPIQPEAERARLVVKRIGGRARRLVVAGRCHGRSIAQGFGVRVALVCRGENEFQARISARAAGSATVKTITR